MPALGGVAPGGCRRRGGNTQRPAHQSRGYRRTGTVRNEFRYGIFMLYLDLDELAMVFANRLFWSVEGPLARWPCMTAAICWQALRPQLKGTPFCPHPNKTTVAKGACHP